MVTLPQYLVVAHGRAHGGHGPKPVSLPILAKGFRPFFLLAALYALLMVPIWLLVLNGSVAAPGRMQPMTWHAHEMLFGFATAVVAGFLLTATSRWTSHETAVGWPLALLVVLWGLGRIATLLPLPPLAIAGVDVLFLPAVALALGRALFRAGNRRNYALLGLVSALAVANALTHAPYVGLAFHDARRALMLALDLIVLIMVVITGRVIPMFTRNATGLDAVHSSPGLDRCAAVLAVASLISHFAVGLTGLTAGISALAGIALVARAWHWGALASRRDPMLWILHVGHAWLAAGFLLRASTHLLPALASSATHAFTAGAMGCLTLGMMSRVALGHTGRMIVANVRTRWAFVAMLLAGLLRVVGPLFPASYSSFLIASGAAWVLAFLLYLLEYTAILTQPRIDGTAG